MGGYSQGTIFLAWQFIVIKDQICLVYTHLRTSEFLGSSQAAKIWCELSLFEWVVPRKKIWCEFVSSQIWWYLIWGGWSWELFWGGPNLYQAKSGVISFLKVGWGGGQRGGATENQCIGKSKRGIRDAAPSSDAFFSHFIDVYIWNILHLPLQCHPRMFGKMHTTHIVCPLLIARSLRSCCWMQIGV